MLQLRSVLQIADNSGAKEVYLVGIPGQGNKHYAYLGDVISAIVKKADPYGHVKNGELVYGLIVRTRKETKRKDGSYIRFDDNACVILQAKLSQEPKGTRFFGPLAREIKERGYKKIASLASEIY